MLQISKKQNGAKNNFRTVALCLGLFASSNMITACGGGAGNTNSYKSVFEYSASLVNDVFLFSFTLKTLQIDAGGRFQIDPKLPNSYLEIGPDFKSNGTLLTVGLAVKDVSNSLGGIKFPDAHALPGGRPLPGVDVGALPSIAVTVAKLHDLTFYFGNSAFGLFVPVNLPIKGAIATFRFYADGKRVGNASFVGQDADGKNSGILLLMTRDLVNTAASKALL